MNLHRTIVTAAFVTVTVSACGRANETTPTTPTTVTAPATQTHTTAAPPSLTPDASAAMTDTPPSSTPAASPKETTSSTAESPTMPSGDPATSVAVRFESGETHVDVIIDPDTPTARDFLSMLPLTLRFEEFNGREKISYLPRQLDTEGAAGSDPEDGDLIYYAPWGNLGFYYSTTGIGFDDNVIHLRTYNATADQLALLEQGDITVHVVE
jgi:hypothetical protein